MTNEFPKREYYCPRCAELIISRREDWDEAITFGMCIKKHESEFKDWLNHSQMRALKSHPRPHTQEVT